MTRTRPGRGSRMTPAPPGLGEAGCRAGERWSGCRAGQGPRQQRGASIRGRSTRADPPPDARGGFADGLSVLIEPLAGLGAEIAFGDELLHPGMDDEALAVGIRQVHRHMQHGVEPDEI